MIVNRRVGASVSRKKRAREAAALCSALMVAMASCCLMADAQKSNLNLSNAELKRLKSTGATLTATVQVKPGSYLARAVLLDGGSQRMGSGTENITIP